MKLSFVMAAGSFLFALAAHCELVTGIGVVVDDAVITRAEIQDGVDRGAETAARVYANDRAAYREEINKITDQQIENLVERKLILHEFETAAYATNLVEALVDDRIRDRIQKEFYGDHARLIKTLEAEGITYETFRRQEREKLIIEYENYQNSSNPKKILISPLKIERFYADHRNDFKVDDQVHLYMIVIKSQAAAGNAHKMAGEILAKIDSGVPFEEMASLYSSGSQHSQGGDRGWVDRDYFRAELANAAFSLKAGQHSGIIDLPDASYLLMVKEVRPAHVRPLGEVRGDIERALTAKENTRLRDLWIQRLKRKSYVQYY